MNKETKIEIYRKMFLIRRMEEELVKYYFDNKVMSFVHFYIGQEAVAVGVCANLTLQDRVLGNHRSDGHYLAKGGHPGRMVAELLGKVTGCCRGKGGSMHMIDRNVNFIGSTPILGSVAPIAAGSALTQKLQVSDDITVSFFGDGASEEGVVFETMNFAALFKLPLLLVVENNLYSVMSKLADRRSPAHDLGGIVTSFGVKYFRADGNDVFDVYQKTKDAIENIRLARQPAVLECITFRHMAHSAPICDDKIGYREIDNESVRRREDSVAKMRQALAKDLSASEIAALENEINLEVSKAIEFGVASPYPAADELVKDVYHE